MAAGLVYHLSCVSGSRGGKEKERENEREREREKTERKKIEKMQMRARTHNIHAHDRQEEKRKGGCVFVCSLARSLFYRVRFIFVSKRASTNGHVCITMGCGT